MRTTLALGVLVFVCLAAPASARDGAAPEVTEGQLQVVGDGGKARGACPLEHTDVKAEISGFVSRVT